MKSEVSNTGGTVELSESSLSVVVSLIANIVDMACEHEPDLELMRLVNFMDLYRTYLSHELDSGDAEGDVASGALETGKCRDMVRRRRTEFVSFEQFIGDSRLLRIAAQAASRDTGILVSAPLPLKLSANSCRTPVS